MKHKARKILNEAIDDYRASKADVARFRVAKAGQGYIERAERKPPTDDEVRGGSPLEGIPLPEYMPSVWTVEWVATRLIAATELAGVGRNHIKRGKTGFWPEFVPTYEDMLGWGDGEFRARPLEAWAAQAPRIPASELRRHAQAELWPLTYLYAEEHEHEARHLMLWLCSKVSSKVKLGRTLRSWGASTQSHRTCRARALNLIVAGLIRDGVAVT